MQSSAGLFFVSMETQSSCRRSGDRLMSRRCRLVKPHVGSWDETMAGREWAALQALCALYLSHFVLFLSSVRLHVAPHADGHTHTRIDTNSPGMKWAVCKKAERTMKTKTGCQREFVQEGSSFNPNKTATRHNTWMEWMSMPGMRYPQINTACYITGLTAWGSYFLLRYFVSQLWLRLNEVGV